MKKYLARLLFIALVFMPVGTKALIIPAIVGVLTYFTADALFVNALGASAVVVGAAIGFFHLKSPTASKPQLTVQLAPLAKMETPTGWTAPAAGSANPSPPVTATSQINVSRSTGVGPTGTFPSSAAFCAGVTAAGVCSTGGTWTLTDANANGGTTCGGTCTYNPGGVQTAGVGYTSSSICPAGYTVSGSSCTLNNANVVMKPADASCGVKRVGNSFSVDAQDPDCQSLPVNIHVSANQITSVADDGVVTEINIDPATSRTEIATTTPNSDGTSTRQTTSIGPVGTADATGLVSGQASSTVRGAGLTKGDPAGSAAAAGSTGGTCGGAGQVKCAVVIDESGLSGLDTSLSTPKTALDSAATSTQTQIESVSGSGKKTNLGLSLSIDWPAGSCTNPSFAIAGHTMVVDLCSKAGEIGGIMDFLFAIGIMFYLFFLGSKAIGAG